MWSQKARIILGVAVFAFAAAVLTAQWFLLLVALGLGVQLLYAHLVFDPEGGLEGSRTIQLEQVREGDGTGTEATIQNTGSSTTFLELRDKLPRQIDISEGQLSRVAALGPGDQVRVEAQLDAPLMGVYDVGPLEARLEDPYELYTAERQIAPHDELLVTPLPAPLQEIRGGVEEFQFFQGEYTVNRPGDGFDFYGLREYAPGDQYRAINWKASAKTGDLMVNQFERTTSTEVVFFLDGRGIQAVGPEHRTPFVKSCRAVATLLDAFFDRRDTPRLIVYGDGFHQVRPGPPERMENEVLETLAMWQPSGDEPFSHAIAEYLPRLEQGSPVVLISALLDDPTIIESVATLLAYDFVVIVVAPGVDDLPGVPEEERKALLEARERTLEDLRGFEVEVLEPEHLEDVAEVTV